MPCNRLLVQGIQQIAAVDSLNSINDRLPQAPRAINHNVYLPCSMERQKPSLVHSRQNRKVWLAF